MGTTPSDRVQLIDRGNLMHPGCCALCGSGNCEDGYVDTGIYYDYEGQVYFCMTCAFQIAEVIGSLSPETIAHIQELLSETATELATVKVELESANERLGHYDAIIGTHISTHVIAPDPSGDVSDSVEPVTEPEPESTDEPAKPADSGESKPKEPTKSSGRRIAPRTKQRDDSTPDAGFTN